MRTLTELNAKWIVDAGFSASNFEVFENELTQKLAVIDAELVDLEKREAIIRANPELSHEGKEKAIAKLFGEKSVFLEKFRDEVMGKLNQATADRWQAMFQAVDNGRFSTGHPAADEVRAGEIRAWFKTVDPAMKEQVYRDALRAGDLETCQALENAPRIFGLLSDSLIQEGRTQRAAKIDPDTTVMHHDLTTFRQVMQHNFARMEKRLEPYKQTAIRAMPERFDDTYRQAKGIA